MQFKLVAFKPVQVTTVLLINMPVDLKILYVQTLRNF